MANGSLVSCPCRTTPRQSGAVTAALKVRGLQEAHCNIQALVGVHLTVE